MAKKVKFIAVLLCFALALGSLIGCGSSQGEVKKPTSTGDSKDKAATEAEEKEEPLAIEEQVIYDANDIKVTATGIEEGIFGAEIKLVVENNSTKDITIQDRDTNVNGFMVSTTMSIDVAAGKKATDNLIIDSTSIKACNLEKIATIEFRLKIYDADSFDDIAMSDVITIETNAAATYTQAVDESGEVLVDKDGIKIVCKGLSTEESWWGPGVILYIENNSKQNITIQVRDVSVNGFMIEPTISEEVAVGKKAMSDISFFSTDLEDNGISQIQDMEFYFTIFDTDSWDDVFDSDIIKLHFD